MAMLFVIAYGMIALSQTRQRASGWFMLSYALCCVAAICQLLMQLGGWPHWIILIGYGAFLGTVTTMWTGVEVLAGRKAPKRQAAIAWGLGMALRFALLAGTPHSLPYELVFQLPFAIMSARTMVAVRSIRRQGAIPSLLAGIFGLSCFHFIAKPFLVVLLTAGVRNAVQVYVAVSSVSTGVLLVAAGLFLLLLVIQKALDDTIVDAETDALTLLANRRALSRIAPRLLTEANDAGRVLYAMVIDLDHFKRINDVLGHAVGDQVLVAFADILRGQAAPEILAVRMGGEEFALFIPDVEKGPAAGDNPAARLGWAIRQALKSFPERGLPGLTFSGGIVRYRPGETLEALLGRADELAYGAKNGGRDQLRLDRDDMPTQRCLTLAA